MNEKCHKCKHYVLQWSFLLKAYVEGCDAPDQKSGCNYEPRNKKAVATIKRRG